MMPSRWSTVLRRVTTEGPYINERMSVLVLTIVVVAGISAVAYADKSVASVSLAPLYFLPLALSALVHPLRISLALSIVCLVLHDLVGPMRDLGTRHLAKGCDYPSWICFRCRRCESTGSAATTTSGSGCKRTRRACERNSLGCRSATEHLAPFHTHRYLDLTSRRECTQPR